jgi:murein tripeptide amidase MpaA
MKKIILNSIITALLLLLTIPVQSQNEQLFFKAAGTPANPKVQVSWNRYNSYEGVADICTKLAKAYPDLVTLESMGKSYQGREMYVLTISDKKSKNPSNKPGYWIDGNIHSSEIQGTEMALYTAWYLCEMYNENAFIKQLLIDKTFYIAPTINPDAREYFAFV